MDLPKILTNAEPAKPDTSDKTPDPADRKASFGPMTFAVALTINAVVSAVLAVLLTLSFVRGGPQENAGEVSGIAAEPAPTRQELLAADTAAPTVQVATPRTLPETPASGPKSQAALPRNVPEQRREAKTETRAPDLPAVSGFMIADPVELAFGKPARLAFRLKPDTARRERLLVYFDGLPSGSGIYGLRRLGDNVWRLDPGQSPEMLIIVPPDAPKSFSVQMRLHRDQGALIEQRTVRVLAKR